MFKLASNEYIAVSPDGDSIIIGTPGDSWKDPSLPTFTGEIAEEILNEYVDRIVELDDDGHFNKPSKI